MLTGHLLSVDVGRSRLLGWDGKTGRTAIWKELRDAPQDDSRGDPRLPQRRHAYELVFTTWGDSVKGRNLRRDLRAAIVVDEEVAPYAFVHIRGHVTLSEDLDELLRFATAIAGRYMGADRAEEFGRRNAVPGELLVRLHRERVIATADVAC